MAVHSISKYHVIDAHVSKELRLRSLLFAKLLPTHMEATPTLVINYFSGFKQFRKSYDYFKRRLRDADSDGNKIDPKRILDIIEKRLMVVMINLSDTDDPYLIFESLIFKGSPL